VKKNKKERRNKREKEKKKVTLEQACLSVFPLPTVTIIPPTLCSPNHNISPITGTRKQSLVTCKAMFFRTSGT